jgi:fructosamine-3-kinase
MRAEIEVYEIIQQLDVPTPQLYGYNLEREVINRDYMFLARLAGQPLHDVSSSLDQENNDALQRELGVYTARMHALHGPCFGYIGGQPEQAPGWRQAFLNMIFALLDDGVELEAQLPLPYQEVRTMFTDLAYVLDEIQQPSLVHWDLWPVNVFVVPGDDGRYSIEGIIDWERAFWGDPEAEAPLVTMLTFKPSFFKGYGRELTAGRSARIRQCMYRLYLWLIMVIEARVRFEQAEHLEWTNTNLEKDLQILRDYL